MSALKAPRRRLAFGDMADNRLPWLPTGARCEAAVCDRCGDRHVARAKGRAPPESCEPLERPIEATAGRSSHLASTPPDERSVPGGRRLARPRRTPGRIRQSPSTRQARALAHPP